MKKITAAILMVILLTSCSRPGPTTRSFQRADITGEWTHRDSGPATQSSSQSYTVSLNLREDGAFEQVIKIDGDPAVQKASGTWVLTGSRISLKGLLTHDWDRVSDTATWTKADADWWFVDWHDSDQRVALFGALHPDPDAFAPWTNNR
jgi:hypothetical protein